MNNGPTNDPNTGQRTPEGTDPVDAATDPVAPETVTPPPPWSEPWLEDLFTYHAPGDVEINAYRRIRQKAVELARIVRDACPACADRTAALRKLRETVMTANAAIATKGRC